METTLPHEDVLIGTTRHLPAHSTEYSNARIVINPTANQSSFALGYSKEAFGQIGGDVDKNREPVPGCPADSPFRDMQTACITYVGSGLETATPAEINPEDFVDDAGAPLTGQDLTDALAEIEYDGYYQRILMLPICFKLNPFLTRVTNFTSADVKISLGDDTDPDAANAFTKYAEELVIPAGESRLLATDTLLPDAVEEGALISRAEDELTNCHHWLVAKFAEPVAKGELIQFSLVGSKQ